MNNKAFLFYLFSVGLSSVSLIYQNISYELAHNEDKKLIFNQNSLYLLRAPDSLKNQVIDFNLPYDSLSIFLKKKIGKDSCVNNKFRFSTKIDFDYENKSNFNKEILIPIRINFRSNCFVNEYDHPSAFNFRIYHLNANNYSRCTDCDATNLYYLKNELMQLNEFHGRDNFSSVPEFIIFDKKIDILYLQKAIRLLSKFYLERLENEAVESYGVKISNLNEHELINFRNRLIQEPISIEVGEFSSIPPRPPFEL